MSSNTMNIKTHCVFIVYLLQVNFTLDPQGHHNSAKTRSRESGLLDDVITLYQYL